MERSTVQRIGDVEHMVTSFKRHLRAENKAPQTITAYTHAPLQLADFLQERGMPADVGSIHRGTSKRSSRICSPGAAPRRRTTATAGS